MSLSAFLGMTSMVKKIAVGWMCFLTGVLPLAVMRYGYGLCELDALGGFDVLMHGFFPQEGVKLNGQIYCSSPSLGWSMSLGFGGLKGMWWGGQWSHRVSPGWVALKVSPRPGDLWQRQTLLKVLQFCLQVLPLCCQLLFLSHQLPH